MKFDLMKRGGGLAGTLFLLIGFCLVVGGCESDSVAPNEELPPPTEGEAAQQAALVAVGLAQVGPQILNFEGGKPRDKDLGVYPYDFHDVDSITGNIVLEYFTGGAGGTHVSWMEADYGLLYTPEGEMVAVTVDLGGGLEPVFELTFDLEGPIIRAEDTASVFGSGTFGFGPSGSSFTILETAPVVMTGVSSFPTEGELLFSSGGLELLVTYDGDDTAAVSIADVVTYTIDLNTGIVSPVED